MAEITVKLEGGGALALAAVPEDPDRWSVTPVGHVDPGALAKAREVVSGYRYWSSHGYPGHALATQVARAAGGEAVLPPVPPLPKGAVP